MDETEIEKLKSQNSIMVEALRALSRLGNAPHLGNSEGNVIAQRALKRAEIEI